MAGLTERCIRDYIFEDQACPCHPEQSAAVIETLHAYMQELCVRSLTKLGRQFIDDELILSQEVIA